MYITQKPTSPYLSHWQNLWYGYGMTGILQLTSPWWKNYIIWCQIETDKISRACKIQTQPGGNQVFYTRKENYLSTSGSTPRDIRTSIIFFITAPCLHGCTEACFPGKWGWSSIVTCRVKIQTVRSYQIIECTSSHY